MSRVACETATKTGFVMVLGEITTKAFVNFDELVRKVVKEIGYDSTDKGFDGNTCAVLSAIAAQSGDIAMGVDKALEAKAGEMTEAEIEAIGAGDQGMMFGFACNETPALMPMPIYLAHNLTRKLAAVRKSGDAALAAPGWQEPGDGRISATANPSASTPCWSAPSIPPTSRHAEIDEPIMEHVIMPTLPADMVDDKMKVYVNPTGRFVIGGPMGDSGVTGRKIIVDTYGGMGRHGGGAFSGKDPTKVDRSAPTLRAGWPRTWWRPAWPTAARCRWPMPSAWRARSRSTSRPSAPARSPMSRSPSWSTQTSTCAPARSSAT